MSDGSALASPAKSRWILDPRTKLINALLVVLTLSLLPFGAWLAYGLIYGLVLLFTVWSGLSLVWLWRRSLLAAPFMITALVLPFVVPGQSLIGLPVIGWQMSLPGTIQAASLILRTWIAVQIFILLMGITPIRDFLWALEKLWMPVILVEIISFAYRYLQLLTSEAQRMATARRARQTSAGQNGAPFSFHLRSLGGFFGSLLLRGLERSERVYAAMMARGYDGTILSDRRFQWRLQDSLALSLNLMLIMAMLLVFGGLG